MIATIQISAKAKEQDRRTDTATILPTQPTSRPKIPPHVCDVSSTITRDVHLSIIVAIAMLTTAVGIAAGPLAALAVLTLCGVHLVYTHVWALATIIAVCDRTGSCHGWMGVITAMGVAITIPWYGLLLCRYRDDTVGRAISGWGRWIAEDICGCVWPYDFHSVPRLIRLSYHFVDLAVHFLPTPWLLTRYEVTPLDCLYAFLISRLWSVSASTFHLTLDWTFLRHWPPRACARKQYTSPFVVEGVVNDIYGLRPALPSSSLHFLYTLEAVTLIMVAMVGAPTVSVLPPISQIEGAMAACVSIGVAFGLAGATRIFHAIEKAQ